jgi:hypothetical protein
VSTPLQTPPRNPVRPAGPPSGVCGEPLGAEPPAPADPLAERQAQGQELIGHLERDQLVKETLRPVPPAPVGARMRLALWGLRLFALLVSAMVIYTFVARLA